MDCKMQDVFDPQIIVKLADMEIPFGKYKGTLLIDLPESYVLWFLQNVSAEKSLLQMLELVYEIKVNGLEYLLEPLKA